jgi:hypothetical protein
MIWQNPDNFRATLTLKLCAHTKIFVKTNNNKVDSKQTLFTKI